MTEANATKRSNVAGFLMMAAMLAVTLAFSAGIAVTFEIALDAPVLGVG